MSKRKKLRRYAKWESKPLYESRLTFTEVIINAIKNIINIKK